MKFFRSDRRVFPKIKNLFFCNNFVRKEGGEGGGKPLADKICKVVLDGFPKAVMEKKLFDCLIEP